MRHHLPRVLYPPRPRSPWHTMRVAATACALLLSPAGCDVGRSILVPLRDASATDAPTIDATLADVADVLVGDVTAVDDRTDDAPEVGADAGNDVAVDAPVDAGPDASPACGLGETSCSGACRNLAADPANCGTCGNLCGSGQRCTAGVCQITCDAPRAICGAGAAQSCVDVSDDNGNCGRCGTVCTPGQVCAASACTTACDAPRTTCVGACVDTQEDRTNCGTCGTACAAGQACAGGVCVGEGALRITLTWSTPGDMDLHVVPPCGTEISFTARMACGGTLDVDDLVGRGPENVFWSATPPAGRYLICPEAFRNEVAGATWTLTVVRGSTTILTRTGVRGVTDGNLPCTAMFPGVVTLDL